MSNYVISSIITAVIGVLVLTVGLYQITHLKELLGKDKRIVESPKFAGLSLIVAGIFGLCFAIFLFLQDARFSQSESAKSFTDLFFMVWGLIFAVLAIMIGLIGLSRRRIIYFIDTPLVRKLQRKYQLIHNVCAILAGLSVIVIYFALPNISCFDDFVTMNNGIPFIITNQIPVILLLPIIIIDFIIEITAWRNVKTKQSKARK